jgi:hypothetical protein
MKAKSTHSLNFRSLLVAMSISIAAVAVGCGGGGGGGTAGAGGGGTGGTACDVPKLFQKYYCATPACHSGTGPAASFDMSVAGWETHLVGKMPMSVTPAPVNLDTMCANMGKVYLMPGVTPAAGLFMDKISKSKPGCGAQMPNLPVDKMTPAELACVQTWADALVAAAH